MIAWLAISLAWADDPPTCPTDTEVQLEDAAWLRAVSLDVRGVVPAPDELALVADGDLSDDVLDAWLTSPEFAARAVRFHRSLLWNNISGQSLVNAGSFLLQQDGIFYRPNSTTVHRGVFGAHCGDFATTFDAAGAPIGVPQADGTVQEGWQMVAPYWDPANPIPVCGFDAQEREVTAAGVACDAGTGIRQHTCGCGPGLAWCATGAEIGALTDAMGEDVERRIAAIVEDDRPYTDLWLGETGWVNGPIVHFLREMTQMYGGVRFDEPPVDPAVLPDLGWSDVDTWVEIPLGAQGAGVLTSPAWLVRFQTNRARAARFYDAFLCQPFQAPPGALPDLADPDPPADLTLRDGCDSCHALLEPAAAWWGRWQQPGGGYLDPAEFPPFDETCEALGLEGGVSTTHCFQYVTTVTDDDELPWIGWLRSFEFLAPEHQDHPEIGPRGLVEETLADGRLATCTAENTTRWLLGRDPTPEDAPWIEELATSLVDSGWSYRELVKAILRDDRYRRVR